MKHEYRINLPNGRAVEFMFPWFFLFSFRDPLELRFCLHFPNKQFKEQGNPVLDFEICLFNFELIGLYIDAFKTHVGLLGFCLNIWYKSTD